MRFSLIFALGTFLAVSLAACDTAEEQAAALTRRGTAFFEAGDLAKASIEFRNALKADPLAVTPLIYLARIAEKNGDLQLAFSHYSSAADQDPTNREALAAAGRLALLFGQTDNAIYRADKLIALQPNEIEGHLLKAAAEIARNNSDAAAAVLARVAELSPGNVEAIGMLAEIEGRRKNYAQAEALLDQGLATAPQNVELLGAKLSLARLREDQAAEIALLRRLHAARPADPFYIDSLALALVAHGEPDAAREIYTSAIATAPEARAIIGKYAVFLEGNFGADIAFQEISALPATALPQAERWQLVAQLAVKAGNLAAAEENFRALGRDGNPLADRLAGRVGLAQVALARGDVAAATATIDAVLAEDRGNETALLLRGAIALTERRFDATIADSRSVLRGHPESIPALTLLARTYMVTGERGLAAQALRDLLRADAGNAEAHLDLARLLSAEAPREALSHLDRAIALRPGATELVTQKADFLLRIGERGGAEAIGNRLVALPGNTAAGERILGAVALARNDLRTAIRHFTTALAAGGDFSALGPLLVQAHVNLGDRAAAAALLEARIAAHPDETAGYLLLASLKRHDGDFAAADALLQRAIAARPDDAASYVAMAQFMMQQGYHADATRLMAIAAARFPDSEQVQAIAASAAEGAGDLAAAQAGYEKILARWPENVIAANNLAALIADTPGADAAALARARSLAERFRASDNPVQLDTLGWVLLHQGEIQDATRLLAVAAERLPTNQQVLYHYAVALERKGLRELARATIARALAGTPNYRGVEDARRLAQTMSNMPQN